MSGFALSPGITPELTDAVILEFALLLAILIAWRGAEGAQLAVAINAVVLGAIKIATDYSDLGDLPVALAGIGAGALLLWANLGGRTPWRAHRATELGIGALLIATGAIKVVLDFYDPFDLLLAALVIAIGLWFVLGRYGRPLGARSVAVPHTAN